MIALTSKEIIAELKRLGIKTRPEIKSYFREYKLYCTPQRVTINGRRAAAARPRHR